MVYISGMRGVSGSVGVEGACQVGGGGGGGCQVRGGGKGRGRLG